MNRQMANEEKKVIPHKLFIVFLLISGLVAGIVNVFLIPPFQNPDEIQHFLYSARFAFDKPHMKAIESRVFEILKQTRWFHFVGIGPGWEKMETLSQVSFVFNFDTERKSTRRTIYHVVCGKLLKLSGITDVLTAFYFMRVLSLIIYIFILVLAYYFFKNYFPSQWPYLLAGMFVVFQFGAIMNSVNYDVFMVLLGSLFFIFGYRYMIAPKTTDLVLLILISAAASFTKLVGFLFPIYLLILILYRIKPGKKWYTYVSYPLIGIAVFIILTAWLTFLFPGRFFSFYQLIFRVVDDLKNSLSFAGEKVLRLGFFNSIIDSFYFCIGWMGYRLSSIWYILLKTYLVVSAVGLFLALISKKLREAAGNMRWLGFLALVLVLQVFSVWLYYGHHLTSQGRYLYPLIIPIVYMVITGLRVVEKWLRFKTNYLIISFILLQVVMIVFALARIISGFYLGMESPHPGL